MNFLIRIQFVFSMLIKVLETGTKTLKLFSPIV